MDTQIQNFLDGRKADRLKKRIKPDMNESDVANIEKEVNEEFLFENWLPNAARRASQLSMVSHPGKFSHPSAKTTSFIARADTVADGFLRTGNVNVRNDVFGNAAALDVYKFLNICLNDGLTILEHLEQSTDTIQNELSIKAQSYNEIRDQFLLIKGAGESRISSDLVKQVYFPVTNEYHLLSVLLASGLMFGLREKIQNMKFSDDAKVARECKRKNDLHNGFDDIYNLTMIGYGGTKPQNISVLNSESGGKAYLLPCFPPELNRYHQHLPVFSFFSQSIWPKKYADSFRSLHKLLDADVNNMHIRQGRDNIIQFVVDEILEEVWLIRAAPAGWSANERYAKLPHYQKVMLDESMNEERAENEKSIDEFIHEMARWFINAYKKILGNEALPFHDDELRHVQKIMNNSRDNLL